jgi:mannosyltransferase
LIVYAREARMYALLTLVTCLSWWLLLGLRRSHTTAKAAAYVFSLTALIYSHPLGLLMAGTLALAGLIDVKTSFGGLRRWLAIHLGVLAFVLPWIGHYLDHPPEFLSGRLPPRFLLGTPIGFVGGNFPVLLGLVGLIALGVARRCFVRGPGGGRRLLPGSVVAYAFLFLWLIVPPVTLYLYSWISYPIFGPARYTVFVAPAYLILVASGLSQLPPWARYPLALALLIVSVGALGPLVFDPELKADWRAFSAGIARALKDRPADRALVIVASADPNRNPEVETARYYLPDRCAVITSEEATADRLEHIAANHVFFAASSRRERHESSVPPHAGPYRFHEDSRYPGLVVYRAVR